MNYQWQLTLSCPVQMCQLSCSHILQKIPQWQNRSLWAESTKCHAAALLLLRPDRNNIHYKALIWDNTNQFSNTFNSNTSTCWHANSPTVKSSRHTSRVSYLLLILLTTACDLFLFISTALVWHTTWKPMEICIYHRNVWVFPSVSWLPVLASWPRTLLTNHKFSADLLIYSLQFRSALSASSADSPAYTVVYVVFIFSLSLLADKEAFIT